MHQYISVPAVKNPTFVSQPKRSGFGRNEAIGREHHDVWKDADSPSDLRDEVSKRSEHNGWSVTCAMYWIRAV